MSDRKLLEQVYEALLDLHDYQPNCGWGYCELVDALKARLAQWGSDDDEEPYGN